MAVQELNNFMEFKYFLLNENKADLSEKIGDILNAIHDIDDGSVLGARQMVKFCEKVVARIRRILHSNWPQTEHKHLKKLQKIGVAIMNSIEQKDDLKELLPSIRQELEDISANLGMPINTFGAQEKPEEIPGQDAQIPPPEQVSPPEQAPPEQALPPEQAPPEQREAPR